MIADEQQGDLFGHLLEQRSPRTPVARRELANVSIADALASRLLPQPVRITVIAVSRRSEEVPRVYRDHDGMHTVVEVTGPDRVSRDWWDRGGARDYFRCVTEDGRLVWIYRDVKSGRWYLHGWCMPSQPQAGF